MADSSIQNALGKARFDKHSLNHLLERYRPFLRLMAEHAIGDGLRRREDASDIVQKTLLESYEAFDAFRGISEAEFSAWMKQILRRNIANMVRDNRAAKRDVRREQHLEDQEGSARLFWWHPPSDQTSPSQGVIMAEAALNLAAALEKLPERQRVAVRLRHLEGQTLDEICAAMERTPSSVAGLLRRGLATLRELIPTESDRR